MKSIESKYRKTELKTGVHLVSISDLFYLRNAQKEIIKINDFPAIIIQYKSKEGLHEQLYVIDKSHQQYFFDKVLADAKVPKEDKKPFKKEDCIGKKLYIAIQEVHYVNNENVILENEKPKIDYQIFETIPCSEGIMPKILGDPIFNNGRPTDKFITYKNISTPFLEVEKEEEPPTFYIE